MEDGVARQLWNRYLPDWTPELVAPTLGGEVIHAAHLFVKHVVERPPRTDAGRRRLVSAILHRVMPLLEEEA